MKKTTAKRLTNADLVRELRAAHANARKWEAAAKAAAERAADLTAELRELRTVVQASAGGDR